MTIFPAALPEGWGALTDEQVRGFGEELVRELPPVHRLYGVAVQAAAVADGSDDALFRHIDAPDTWSVVHLTWTGKRERAAFPAAPFTGTFAAFREAYAE